MSNAKLGMHSIVVQEHQIFVYNVLARQLHVRTINPAQELGMYVHVYPPPFPTNRLTAKEQHAVTKIMTTNMYDTAHKEHSK